MKSQRSERREAGTVSPRSRNITYAVGMLVLGLALSLAASLHLKLQVEAAARSAFDFTAANIKENIAARLFANAQVLRGGAGLFDASVDVTREDWGAYVSRLQLDRELPGTQGIGYAVLVPREGLARHVREIRAQGFPNYSVRPEGGRDVYSAIIYLEPFAERNLRAFGFDMLSEAVRRAAMERARDENAVALSGKVVLVQETGQDVQPGCLMYIPVYRHGQPIQTLEQRRAALQGWVYSPYRLGDLMRGTLAGWDSNPVLRPIRLEVYDGDSSWPQALLFDSRSRAEGDPARPASITRSIPLDFAGHRWTVVLSQYGGLASATAYRIAWIALCTGTVISLLLSWLLLSLMGTRDRARRMAGELTLELRDSEEKYRKIFDNDVYAIGIFDQETRRILDANRAFTRVYGYSREELLSGMTATDLSADMAATETSLSRAAHEGGTFIPLRYHRRKDGTPFPVEIVGSPYLWRGREVMFALAHDITDRVQAEEALRATRIRMENVIEGTHVGIWEWNVQSGEVVFNERWAQIIGHSLASLAPVSISTWESLVHPEDLQRSNELLERHFAGELPIYDCECRMRHRDGGWVWVHDRGTLLSRTADGRPLMMFGTHSDSTERKEAEAQLRDASLENRNLLVELQHRAKNSFGMILGMISFAQSAASPEAKSALEELVPRVGSIAELYSLLYSSGSYASLSLDDYCKRIAAPLIQLREGIGLIEELEAIVVSSKKAAPIGLILTELITNALKYAFPGGRTGTIRVSLRRKDSCISLEVVDDGAGLPPGFDLRAGTGMGFTLINGLAAQLNGTFKIESAAPGLRCSLEFPLPTA